MKKAKQETFHGKLSSVIKLNWNVKLLVYFLKIGQREPFLSDIFPTGEHTKRNVECFRCGKTWNVFRNLVNKLEMLFSKACHVAIFCRL